MTTLLGRPRDTEKRELAFKAYRKFRSVTRVSEEIGVDKAQISRWKNEEDWDTRIRELANEINENLGLTEEQNTDITLDFDDENAHYDRAKELALRALTAIRDGKVEFRSMSEAMRAIQEFREIDMLRQGKETQKTVTEHRFSLSGFNTTDPAALIMGLLSIGRVVDPAAMKELAEKKEREDKEEKETEV